MDPGEYLLLRVSTCLKNPVVFPIARGLYLPKAKNYKHQVLKIILLYSDFITMMAATEEAVGMHLATTQSVKSFALDALIMAEGAFHFDLGIGTIVFEFRGFV